MRPNGRSGSGGGRRHGRSRGRRCRRRPRPGPGGPLSPGPARGSPRAARARGHSPAERGRPDCAAGGCSIPPRAARPLAPAVRDVSAQPRGAGRAAATSAGGAGRSGETTPTPHIPLRRDVTPVVELRPRVVFAAEPRLPPPLSGPGWAASPALPCPWPPLTEPFSGIGGGRSRALRGSRALPAAGRAQRGGPGSPRGPEAAERGAGPAVALAPW